MVCLRCRSFLLSNLELSDGRWHYYRSKDPNLQQYGLEFAVAATFIAIVVPNITTLPIFLAALSALVSSVLFAALDIELGLVISSIVGMTVGYLCEEKMKR